MMHPKHFDKYPGSLLSRQYALCRVQTLGVKRYFVVFNNLFHGTGHVPTNIYDLKVRVLMPSTPHLELF